MQANQGIMSMVPLVFIFVVFYFFLIRPQQQQAKKVQAMIADLKKGDKVITSGGMIGTISSIQEDYLVLNVGDADTKIEVVKSSVIGLRQ